MVNSISGSGSWANFQMQMNTEAMQKHRDEMFNKIDSNSDGGIDKAEFSALAKKMSAIAGISSNSSTGTDTTQSVDDVFSTYDTNGDGNLSKDELDAYMKANPPPPPPGAKGGFMGAMNAQGMQKHQDEMFSKLDSNSDGSIDKTEFASLAKKISENTGNALDVDNVFSTYDTDGDGKLSKDELNSYMEANRPPMPMQNATSAYSANSGTDQISSLLEYLRNQAATDTEQAATINGSISNLLELLDNKAGDEYNDSLMNLIA
jgi:Ca2+-binding EF-hand superfamily protein